ncbi:hypothetical protein ID858_16210 [Xenorhabdus sp. DI]|uniref:hypothetical protein n=1 Tax=Xenorhabdus doucetiae TaxID=351671 RepID=UPI00198C76CB|nr:MULTISPECIES: hypothetical protein [unclassified Xenorhabdus]MBD2786241.1 hypothetical protein [Xenorhabdus sp. 3]MBD2790035.1 hypothetical protein [Xenorhabdus sp. DI]
MPFNPPFRKKFYKGDLIYGLNPERTRYINGTKAFEDARVPINEYGYPPIVIDYYLIPAELNQIKCFVKKNIDTNNENKLAKIHDMKSKYNYTKNDEYKKYKDNFFNHLKYDNKYISVTKDLEYNRTIMGRKCKGGLSWVSIGNNELIKNIHVHFILDGIDMESVTNKHNMNKYYNSMTAKELRWIFRHRANHKIAEKVQFWKNNNPASPPWNGPESFVWINYAIHLQKKNEEKEEEERYDGLSRLFHLL